MSSRKLHYLKSIFSLTLMLLLIFSTTVFAQSQDLSIQVISPQELKAFSEPNIPNGCGGSGGFAFPDTAIFVGKIIVNFSIACNNHDRCYGTLGAVRRGCDENIYIDLQTACREDIANGAANLPVWQLRFVALRACQAQVWAYYLAIVKFGPPYYEAGQNAAAVNVASHFPVMLLPEAQIGQPYDQTIIGINGIRPYTFKLVFPQLPLGMYLTSDGHLTGVPSSGNIATTFRGWIVAMSADGYYWGARAYTLQLGNSAPTPTNTNTPTATWTSTNTDTPTPTDTPTWTPTNTDTPTPTGTSTNTATATPTDTPTPTATSTDTPTPTTTTCSVPFSFTMQSSHDLGAASYYLQDCGTQIEMNVVVPANMSTPGTTGDCGRGDGIVGAKLYPPNQGEIGWYILAGQGQGLNICHGADETFGPFYFPYIPGSYLEFFAGTVSTSTAYITVR